MAPGFKRDAGKSADNQMIDACHIRPWSTTKDDRIQNGIALSPILHRAPACRQAGLTAGLSPSNPTARYRYLALFRKVEIRHLT
ncbi:MAG: HNH endonuclease [Cryomorphaceae bacterium]